MCIMLGRFISILMFHVSSLQSIEHREWPKNNVVLSIESCSESFTLRAESYTDPVQVKQPGPDCEGGREGRGGEGGEDFKGGSLVTYSLQLSSNSCKGCPLSCQSWPGTHISNIRSSPLLSSLFSSKIKFVKGFPQNLRQN